MSAGGVDRDEQPAGGRGVGEQADAAGGHLVTDAREARGPILQCRPPGRRTAANAERSPEVSLLWPQSGRDGYALIVDGRAEVRVDGDRTLVAVKPTGAVLHVTPEGKGQGPGCVPVLGHGA